MMMITALLTSMMMLACGAPRAGLTTETAQRGDFKERDEINQTYQLAAGASVGVGVEAGVEVEGFFEWEAVVVFEAAAAGVPGGGVNKLVRAGF